MLVSFVSIVLWVHSQANVPVSVLSAHQVLPKHKPVKPRVIPVPQVFQVCTVIALIHACLVTQVFSRPQRQFILAKHVQLVNSLEMLNQLHVIFAALVPLLVTVA
jgi:hypothetical protein